MMTGIVLLAFGKPCYGYAAYNMAKSIKYNGCSLPVMLFHDGNQKIDLSVFDFNEKIDITDSPGLEKVKVYFKSPFNNTLFLDVDGIALKDITPIIDNLISSGVPYSHYIHTVYHSKDYEYPEMCWASRETLEKYYPESVLNLPATQSSIQFYKKCAESDKLYNRVVELMKDPIPISELRNLWGGGQPDELYLNIALSEMGYHALDKNVMFFGDKISSLSIKQIKEKYYMLSIFGGKNLTKLIYQEFYDRYMIDLMRKNNDAHRYKIPHIMSNKHADTNRHLITLKQRSDLGITVSPKERYTVSPEKIHLITTYYKTKTKERQDEIDFCLKHNIDNKEIDSITVITECDLPYTSDKVNVVYSDKRATFNDCLKYQKDCINIISNSDIYFDNANTIKQLDFKYHYAITRHEKKSNNIFYKPFFGSQDVWIGKNIKPIDVNVPFGIPRCDQVLAYELNKQKPVKNPAKLIKCVHVHEHPERSYTYDDEMKEQGMLVNDDHKGVLRKRMLIIQPGHYGDILIILPIAWHYYNMNYLVDILCPQEYHDLFENIDYVTPVSKKEILYSKVIDLSFGINLQSDVHRWWIKNKKRFNSFVDAKYKLAGVSGSDNNLKTLRWNRNIEKEESLYSMVVKKKPYTLVHEDYGINIPVDGIRVERIKGYNIFDWYKVIVNAEEIHCIDSGVSNFIRYIKTDSTKYIYHGRNGGGVMMSKYDNWINNEVSIEICS